jgi:Xaa-Pro aminopeptidase
MLSKEEKQWLNDYHKMVYDTLAPYLDYDHRQWLAEATQPVL